MTDNEALKLFKNTCKACKYSKIGCEDCRYYNAIKALEISPTINKKEKLAEFYTYIPDGKDLKEDESLNIAITWRETFKYIKQDKGFKTFQIGWLTSDYLIKLNYDKIIIHEPDRDIIFTYNGDEIDVKDQNGNDLTDKAIYPAHNIFKMYMAGAFEV